jgi:hypothetical protein
VAKRTEAQAVAVNWKGEIGRFLWLWRHPVLADGGDPGSQCPGMLIRRSFSSPRRTWIWRRGCSPGCSARCRFFGADTVYLHLRRADDGGRSVISSVLAEGGEATGQGPSLYDHRARRDRSDHRDGTRWWIVF